MTHNTTITSISGIRGIFGQDLDSAETFRYIRNFARLAMDGSKGGNSAGADTSPAAAISREFLLGRDPRTTGSTLSRLVIGALLSCGASVIDFGIVSTPALFRESRKRASPAIIVTASHNEPEWNGLKFVIEGRGVRQPELEAILAKKRDVVRIQRMGRVLVGAGSPSYNSELISSFGGNSCEGTGVVLDLNGGAAIGHAPPILRALGCRITALGDVPGLFSRTIDPTADPLDLLCKTVKRQEADIGLAFDCDGDRLVVVDNQGRKRTGDYMLTLALKEILPRRINRSVVVSQDTTQAVDEVVGSLDGKVYRAKVGEANVIGTMLDKGAEMGGEGSSGGLIDTTFNYCRDSMVAAIAIIQAIKRRGATRVFNQVRSYGQARLKIEMSRQKALAVVKRLQKENPEGDTTDGIKIWPSRHAWVLVRPSGTEDTVRISAEARSSKEADELAKTYVTMIKRLAS